MNNNNDCDIYLQYDQNNNKNQTLPSQIPETTKLNFDYQQEKEKYDNLIQDKEIEINKEDFSGG